MNAAITSADDIALLCYRNEVITETLKPTKAFLYTHHPNPDKY